MALSGSMASGLHPFFPTCRPLLCLIALLLRHIGPVDAASSAIGLRPSPGWIGIDGTWSAFDIQVGSNPPRHVSLFANTILSEIWVVEPTGCSPNPLCYDARGGVYDVHQSGSWQSLGAWSAGLAEPGYAGANGDYGLETVQLGSILRSSGPPPVLANGTLVAGINATDYYIGFLGLGILQGNFSGQIRDPLLVQLAETLGSIPSHSYAYTAGASYANNGTPASLTLGGFDANRFDGKLEGPKFSIDADIKQPTMLLRGIVANTTGTANNNTASSDNNKNNNNATSTTTVVFPASTNTTAVIDTTTPFLWMPASLCDSMASALGLVWNETLGLYVYASDQQYNDYLAGRGPALTFALSSFDNTDTFGDPLAARGVVNLTISSAAFALAAHFPFHPTMKYGDPAIPYFPLKRMPPSHSGRPSTPAIIIIGRAFMQEVYLIMHYDNSHFSLHPARFPDDAHNHVRLVDIGRPPNSQDSGGNATQPSLASSQKKRLSKAATAGIAVGAAAGAVVAGLVLLCLGRRRRRLLQQRRQHEKDRAHEDGRNNSSRSSSSSTTASQDGDSTADSTKLAATPPPPPPPLPPSSSIERIFSFILRRRWSRRSAVTTTNNSLSAVSSSSTSSAAAGADAAEKAFEVVGSFRHPVEVGAGAEHERYEMPAPLPPVELDGMVARGRMADHHQHDDDDDDDDDDATAVLGIDRSPNLSAYEVARRRLQRQLRGPVPTYSPPEDPSVLRRPPQQEGGDPAGGRGPGPGATGHGGGGGGGRPSPSSSLHRLDEEKDEQDVSPVPHYRPSEHVTAATTTSPITRTGGSNKDSPISPISTVPSLGTPTSATSGTSLLSSMLPSPMTPHSADWTTHFDLPSPMTVAPPPPPPFSSMAFPVHRSSTGSTSSRHSSTTNNRSNAIDAARVVCLGPLPENVPVLLAGVTPPKMQPPQAQVEQDPEKAKQDDSRAKEAENERKGGMEERDAGRPEWQASPSPPENEEDSLGTNYTLDEEERLRSEREPRTKEGPGSSPRPAPAGRIDFGSELIHVPQLAERRYSWEGQKGEEESGLRSG